MDIVSRFLLASFQGEIFIRPSRVNIHLLGIQETPALLSVSRDHLDLLTEPSIVAWLAKEFQSPHFTEASIESIDLTYFKDKRVVFLNSNGLHYEDVFSELSSVSFNAIFVFGAQEDLSQELVREISEMSEQTMFLSLGKTEYLASQTATILRYLITKNILNS